MSIKVKLKDRLIEPQEWDQQIRQEFEAKQRFEKILERNRRRNENDLSAAGIWMILLLLYAAVLFSVMR